MIESIKKCKIVRFNLLKKSVLPISAVSSRDDPFVRNEGTSAEGTRAQEELE